MLFRGVSEIMHFLHSKCALFSLWFQLSYNAVGREAIEGLRFLALPPSARRRGEKMQPFNRFHSRLFTWHKRLRHSWDVPWPRLMLPHLVWNPIRTRLPQVLLHCTWVIFQALRISFAPSPSFRSASKQCLQRLRDVVFRVRPPLI